MSTFAGMVAIIACGLAAAAGADPLFEFTRPEKLTEVHWTATAQFGLNATSGNARVLGVSGNAQVARKDRHNRGSLAADVAVSRARVLIATEQNGIPGIGPEELRTVEQTTRQAWSVRSRYDRFLGARGSAFIVGGVSADRPAGKRLVGTGQIGYGRNLVTGAQHTLRVEAGYDLTYEDRVSRADPVAIHSGRVFAGYGAAREELSTEVSLEVLTNLNEETAGARRVLALDDTRLLGKASLTWKLNGRLAVGLKGVTSYDTAPAPRPPPPGTKFETGFAPPAQELDVALDLVLIATFL